MYVAYYYIKADSFKSGDKVYIKNDVFKDVDRAGCLYRLIRPLTLNDTLNHYLTRDQVSAIQSNGNSLEAYIIPSTKLLLKDSLIKHQSYCIGYFNGYYIKKIKAIDGSNVLMNFISIKLNDKLCNDERYVPKNAIPSNYIMADSAYYIYSEQVSNKDILPVK